MPSEKTQAQAFQDDIRDILDALDLGTHARPISPHAVVHEEILPRIEQLKAKLQKERRALHLKWTDDLPDEEGAWWALWRSYPEPTVHKVHRGDGGFLLKMSAKEDGSRYVPLEDLDTENIMWAGPIPEPNWTD